MVNAGINMDIFSPHSVRSASTSLAKRSMKVPLTTILKTAGWTRANTFTRYCDKPIMADFADAILD